MEYVLRIVENAGDNGIETRELLKTLYEKWGFRLSTIKGYVSDLEELDKIRVVGSIIYHMNIQPPKGLRRIMS